MCKALWRTESNSSSVQVKYILIYHFQSWSCGLTVCICSGFLFLLWMAPTDSKLIGQIIFWTVGSWNLCSSWNSHFMRVWGVNIIEGPFPCTWLSSLPELLLCLERAQQVFGLGVVPTYPVLCAPTESGVLPRSLAFCHLQALFWVPPGNQAFLRDAQSQWQSPGSPPMYLKVPAHLALDR